MALEMNVNNIEEFQIMIDNKDFRISESITKTILDNVNTKKKHIHIISINVLENNTVLDLTLEKKFFIETLEENLKFFIERERYEDCQNIVNAINQLKNNNSSIGKKKRKK
jgi:protein-arginine kinase activator protein McsA